MKLKKYKQLRIIITIFVSIIISLAINSHSYLLTLAAVLTGMVFMALFRHKAKIKADERDITIQEKAAKLTYAIFAPTIGIASVLLLIPTHSGLAVFSKTDFTYLESLGMIFAYITLFMISIFAISYHFLNQKFGGGRGQ